MINRNRLPHTTTNACIAGSLHVIAYLRTQTLAHNHNSLCERHVAVVRKAISEAGLGEFLCETQEEMIAKNHAAYHSNVLTRSIFDPEQLALASLVGYATWKLGGLEHAACPVCALGDLEARAVREATHHQRLIAEANGFLARN